MRRDRGTGCVSARVLSTREIDRRIHELIEQVTSERSAVAADDGSGVGESDPRWIRPDELVRRMRPFMVYN